MSSENTSAAIPEPIQENVGQATEWFSRYLGVSPDYEWMIGIFAVLIATGIVSFIVGKVMRAIAKGLERSKSKWDDIFFASFIKPVKFLIWMMGISYAIDLIYAESRTELLNDITNQRDVAVVIAIIWALNRFITKGREYYIRNRVRNNEPVDVTAVQAVTKLMKIALNISAVLIILQNVGISISGVLAFGGVGGIAVGFAAKDMLANFFGALIIYFDRPFKVGDWIRSPDQEIEGTVEDIGWRMTTIRTFDKRPLYVPNSVFTNVSVENPSRMTHRRIYETVGVRYDDIAQMSAITDDVRAMLIAHEAIDEKQTLMVNFDAFNASSCDFFIYTFTHTTNWVEFHGIKQDVLLKIADIIDGHGAEIAFPTQTVHLHRGSDAQPETGK